MVACVYECMRHDGELMMVGHSCRVILGALRLGIFPCKFFCPCIVSATLSQKLESNKPVPTQVKSHACGL